MNASTAIEYRFMELRREGERSVSGTVVRFDDEAVIEGVFRERIGRHALRPDDTILNLQHDRAKPLARLGGSLRFVETATALELRAEVVNTPSGDEAIALVDAGILRGISVEMAVKKDKWTHYAGRDQKPLRVIHDAVMRGVSLVDRPAYPQSSIERWEAEAGNAMLSDCSRKYLYL